MHLRVSLALALALITPGGAAADAPYRSVPATAKPQRIVSLNLCADQLLVLLADRSQIAGVTRYAADPGLSAVARQAKGLPVVRNSAEQVLAINPDLVFGTPAFASSPLTALRGRRYRTLELKSAAQFADIVASVRQTAAAVGHPARGEALIARMRADLAAIGRPGQGAVAAYYQRRGYMTGTGTLVDDLMRRIGLVNLATRLGRPALSQVSLEEMIAARPDYLIVEAGTQRVEDQGTEMLHHRVLDAIPRIVIPQSWTVCGGPAYVRAAQAMAHQIATRPATKQK